MISAVYDWIKNIILFMTGMTIILNLMSKSSYKKYAKFISGILLIILIMKPIINIIDKNQSFNFSLKSYEYMQNAADASLISDAENIKNSALINEYKRLLAQQTEKLLMPKGLRLISLEVELEEEYGSKDFGSIKSMYITAGYQQEESADVNVSDIVIEQIIISIGEEDRYNSVKDNKQQGSSPLEINVKNAVADFYNLDSSHINIIIREEYNG